MPGGQVHETKFRSPTPPGLPNTLTPESREMLAKALRKVIERYEKKTGKRVLP